MGSTSEAAPELLDALEKLASADLSEMTDQAVLDRLHELNRIRRLADAAFTRAVGAAHARGAGEIDGCVSTKSWLRHQARLSQSDANAYVDAAVALPDLPRFAALFGAGQVDLEHVGALAELHKRTNPQVAGIADACLADTALEHGPRHLRLLTKQIREHFQDDADGPPPEPDRFVKLAQTFGGTWSLHAALTPEVGAMLRAAMDAATPRPAPDDDRTAAERRHDAFADLIRLAVNSAELPTKRGERPHLGVLVPFADLRDSSPVSDEAEAYLATLEARSALLADEPPAAPTPAQALALIDLVDPIEVEAVLNAAAAAGPYFGNDPNAALRWPPDAGPAPTALPPKIDAASSADPAASTWPPDANVAPVTWPAEAASAGWPPDFDSDPSPPRDSGPPPRAEALPLQQLTLAVPGQLPLPGDGALTDYGDVLTPDAARRLACDAQVYRVVMSPKNLPMDLGQRVRLVPAPLRRALVARDRHCRFPGCDMPPAYTDAHHVQPWSQGGPTAPHNLVLLCSWHHHRVHDHHWTLRYHHRTNTVSAYRPDGTQLLLPSAAGNKTSSYTPERI